MKHTTLDNRDIIVRDERILDLDADRAIFDEEYRKQLYQEFEFL